MARPPLNNNDKHSASTVTSKNTAYVIFTSGSTGRPKGVVVEHEAFCTSSFAYSEAMLMNPCSRVFNFASVTFDVGLMENLSPLTMGACVCVPNNDQKMTDLASAISNLQATWAFLTPSVANLLEPALVPSLKVLVCGGEAMSKENVLKWADCVSLVNGYGPTEAAVIAVVNSRVLRGTNPANTGFAHANAYAWIGDPDDHHHLAPLGCAGELFLEGPLLAREYLNDEEKTAKAFIVNPAWSKLIDDEVGEPRRIYKTGDLVKYNHDGTIHFIGRKDNQIKLHGQRMELGEIEHNLALADHIRHAVALLPKAGLYKQRLVAVVSMSDTNREVQSSGTGGCVLLQGDTLRKAQKKLNSVREHLSNHVPAYMMPAFYVILETMPIMVSGKLDRKQVEKMIETLDEPTYRKITEEEESSASSAIPITETVQQLREVWAPVFNLPVDQIDPSRSFMSQGGDSLVAMSIIARCRKIGITLSLQQVLQSKSLFHVAKSIEARETTRTAVVTDMEEKVDQLFELSPVQRQYFQIAGDSSDHTKECRFNQSQMFSLRRTTKAANVETAIQTIVKQHSMFRARFERNQDGIWRQKIVNDVSNSYRFGAHKVDSPNELLRLLAASQRSLDITNGPLLAVDLFDSDQYGQVLSLIAHHLVIDVVSWGILDQQLEDILASRTQTIEKPTSFQAWCALQQEHAAQRNTSDIKSILPFNVRRANTAFWAMTGKPNTYGDVEHASFDLDKITTGLFLGKANDALRTQPLEILMTSLFHSFRTIFPERSLPTLFNETHGRDVWDSSVDITGTTGWFTSLYPITIPSDEDCNSSALETLKRAKDLRRSLPGNGREYFAHRYLTPDGRWRFSDHMPMEMILNYTGQSHDLEQRESLLQPFEFAKSQDEAMFTADVGAKTARMALFEVSVSISNNETRFAFMWSKHMQHQERIRQWISCCERTLKELAEQLANTRPEPTLSDYPLLPTDYKGLQQLSNETFRETGINNLDQVEEVLICSPMQEGLLLAQIRNPQQYINFVISETALAQKDAQVDVQRLARAWQKVVDRHQSLRTAFVYSVCKGHAFDQIVLKRVDGGAKNVTCEDEDYEKPLRQNSLRKVNEDRRPMLPQQLTICTTASGKCYTQLELNHAVIDGGSGALIMRDLALAYENRLPEDDKPSYSEYIRYITKRGLDSATSYWKGYLDSAERCHLPHMASASDTGPNRLNDMYLQYWRFPELQAFCRAHEVTLSNVMLAGWAFVLSIYTSRSDVCFGNLTAGREAPVDGIQDTVGAFINMLVCRVNFEGSKTLMDVIRGVQNDYIDALEHQHCSLAKIQHDLGFSGEPLFNTAMSIQNQISSRDAEREGDAIKFNPIADYDPTEVSSAISSVWRDSTNHLQQYAVTVNVRSAVGDESCRIKHWTSRLSLEDAEKLRRTYVDVLDAILYQSDQLATQVDITKKPHTQTDIEDHVYIQPENAYIPDNSDDDEADMTNVEADQSETASLNGSFSSDDTAPERVQPRGYRRLIRQCVREVIEQMLDSGMLVHPTDGRSGQAPNKRLREFEPSGKGKKVAVGFQSFSNSKKGRFRNIEHGVDPLDEMSHTLRQLWSPLLHVPENKIRDDDSFFYLGGDSILAMELTRHAREAGVKLTVADIFRSPAFSDMAETMVVSAQNKRDDDLNSEAQSVDGKDAGPDVVEPKRPRPFSLLDTADTDAFVQDYICPKVGVFRSGILDAFPVTDFQALGVAATFLKSRWMLNYLTFDGVGTVSLERIRRAACRTVELFDILRTVFLPCGNNFIQVVLRTLQPQVYVYETEMDLAEYTRQLRDESPLAIQKWASLSHSFCS